MRTAFIDTLTEAIQRDRNVMLVVGDLGFGVVQQLAAEHPTQFLNAGIAEQAMTGIAAGLAMSGKTVFTYSIGNFPTIRCLEQIRNDIAYHRANVKIVAVGGGLAYGSLGMSHHATEDISVMRSMPNMTVFAPGDPIETVLVTKAALGIDGPCYIRLGRAGEPTVHETTPSFAVGKAIVLKHGSDVTLISSGAGLKDVAVAAEKLERSGVSVRLLSMPTIKPLDVDAVCRAAKETRAVFTIEEHSIVGGLGSAVAEVLAEMPGDKCRLFRRLGIPDTFMSVAGDRDYLRKLYRLDPEGIANTVMEYLAGTQEN